MPKSEHFCHFNIWKTKNNQNYNTQSTGFLFSRFGFVQSGACKLYCDDKIYEFQSGDLMFYPAHTPYHAEWTTENGCVEMYALEFDTDFFSLFHRDFSVIKAPPLADSFLSLLQGFENKNDLQALQAFYTILSYAAEHISKTDTVTDTILPALEWLREENDDFKVKDLAALCFVSESRFYTLFKKATGYSPVDYKNLLKLHRALPLLRSGATVEEICARLHFCSPCYFRRLLRKFFNKTPSQLKNETPRV